jgi:hypothetical protein
MTLTSVEIGRGEGCMKEAEMVYDAAEAQCESWRTIKPNLKMMITPRRILVEKSNKAEMGKKSGWLV